MKIVTCGNAPRNSSHRCQVVPVTAGRSCREQHPGDVSATLGSLSDSGWFGCNSARERESERPIYRRFSLHIPDMRVRIYKICTRSPTFSPSNTSVRQAT